jgi:tetratricopeptide (TPR) repeat protein
MRSKTKLGALAILLGVAVAVPALGQSGQLSQYAACPDPPPKLSPAQVDAAHVVFQAGQVAYDEGDYAKAVDAFKDAYKRDCSKTVLLVFIAKAYETKGDKAEAINALETYLKRAPNAADAETIKRRIENLKAQLAAQPTATATTTTTATATATATAPTATATSTAPPPPERAHSAGPWILVGAGGAAVVTGAILLGVGLSKRSQANTLCPNGSCAIPADKPRAEALSADGTTFANIGIIVGSVGLAAVVGGLIWHFVEPTGPVKDAKLQIVPQFQPGYGGQLGYGGLTVAGQF